ncbi:MAG TPA: beta-ketoacyl-[acyl-carrier-protein] synthase family protein [Ktedonobacteraceae bacterium]
MTGSGERRVVVTGIGVIAPNGIGRAAFWQACLNGVSGIKPIQRFSTAGLPIEVAGEVADFRAAANGILNLERKFIQRTDRVTHFASVASEEARQDARLDFSQEDLRRVGVVIANTLGGIEFVVEQIKKFYTQGPRGMSAYTAIAWLQIANAGQISLNYGLRGFNKAPVSDTASGLEALTMGANAIRRGAADIIFAGGTEALLHPLFLTLFGHSGLSAPGHDACAYRPFDQRASGMLLAEGAGICVLEEYQHARRRQAPIYGEILGSGQTSDARTPLPPSASGTYYARAIKLALQDAQLQPDEIDYFNLDGRAEPMADLAEAAALYEVFGERVASLPTSVPRSMLGHSYAAAGALDAIITLLALREQRIPPTINSTQPDPLLRLKLVREQAQPFVGSTALVSARSLSGSNIVLAMRALGDVGGI